MKNNPLLLFCASLLIVLTACGTGGNIGGSGVPSNASFEKGDYQKIVSANNELGFRLLAEVEADKDGNTFISPTSLLMALSMVYNGADGVTKEEIAKVLEVKGIDVADLNKANASLMAMLDKASVKKINNWVKKSTNGTIEEIVDAPLDIDLVAILINAIYFKGDWTHEFKKEKTEKQTFHLADRTTKEIPLMTLTEELSYMENDAFQAVKLPYGDGEMSMQVFLPKETSNLAEFEQTITAENWLAWNAMFETKEGTIKLPKFKLTYETLLNETLQKLGMDSAFSEAADFSKMIQESNPIWISKVKQKTFLDVDEKGTEAAAVTSIEMVSESATIDRSFHMEVNRPFFITITDEETGLILFTGTIANPQQ